MVIRDVGDEDIMIIGYMFSAQIVTRDIDGQESGHALCLRAWALVSDARESSTSVSLCDGTTIPDSGVTVGAAAPVLLASFRLLSLATYALRTEEKFYENVCMSGTMGTVHGASHYS